MMIKIYKKFIAIIVALSIGLGGCATVARSPMSAAETQLEQQSSWFSRSDVQGALFVALLAGGICAAAGGNAGQCVASAAGGALLGYSAGAYMNSLRTNYRSQEAMLAKTLSDIQVDNQRIATYLATERQVIREKVARLNVIKQGLQQKSLNAAKVQSELNGLRETQKKLAKKASDLGKVQNKWEETYAMLNVRDHRVESEIGTMRQQIQTIQQDNESFKRQLNDINISTVG